MGAGGPGPGGAAESSWHGGMLRCRSFLVLWHHPVAAGRGLSFPCHHQASLKQGLAEQGPSPPCHQPAVLVAWPGPQGGGLQVAAVTCKLSLGRVKGAAGQDAHPVCAKLEQMAKPRCIRMPHRRPPLSICMACKLSQKSPLLFFTLPDKGKNFTLTAIKKKKKKILLW